MGELRFRKAEPSELSEIEEIYAGARAFMRETGNPTQWGSVYPPREVIASDIENGRLFVAEDGEIEAVFAYIPGVDPTYGYIEGAWKWEGPYSAVHRVASRGKRRGMIRAIMDYCFSLCESVRIDTHENNSVMQKALESYGFVRCGIIYLESGDPRIAYQKNK